MKCMCSRIVGTGMLGSVQVLKLSLLFQAGRAMRA